MKKVNNLTLIIFFGALTLVSTAVVILTWEKVLLPPYYTWVGKQYPGDENRELRWKIEQRTEHFFISLTVDIIVVTLLLRMVSRKQRELRASEERYRALFEHANDGIGVVTSTDHRFVEVNNKFGEILGYQPQQLVGKNINDLGLNIGDGSKLLVDGSAPGGSQLAIHTSTGKPLSVSVSFTTLSTDKEKLLILIIHDLSEHKRLEAEKEEMQRQLFQSSKLASVGELSAGVAHEINNPLNAIINFAQLLKDDDVARNEFERQMVDGIIDEGGRIARITHDLLTFARRDSHELTHVNISETINNSMSLFGRQLEKDDISVELNVDEALPPVMADGSRLRQVIVNMISNARNALRDKPSAPKLFRITAHAVERAGGPWVMIEFYDNGMGIKREDIDKIFDPFFTTRRDDGGTGLGLSLSFGIIRDYGGKIAVESEVCGYTRFTVELPAVGSEETEYAESFVGGR